MTEGDGGMAARLVFLELWDLLRVEDREVWAILCEAYIGALNGKERGNEQFFHIDGESFARIESFGSLRKSNILIVAGLDENFSQGGILLQILKVLFE